MSEQGKAFNEVRALLTKLDRSIDEARNRRLGVTPPPPPENTPDSSFTNSNAAPIHQPPTAAPAAQPAAPIPGKAPQRSRNSKYGRARPLNRSGDNGTTNPTGQWGKPTPKHSIDDDTMIG